MSSANLDATGHRWVAALANYTFNIKYRSGKLNADADALSRLPGIVEPSNDNEYRVISPEIFKVLCQAQQLSTKYVSTLCASIDYRLDVDDTNNVDLVNPWEWRVQQREDPIIGPFLKAVTQKTKPEGDSIPSLEGKCILKEYSRLVIKRDITENDQEHLQQIGVRTHYAAPMMRLDILDEYEVCLYSEIDFIGLVCKQI